MKSQREARFSKREIMKALESLPDDATVEDAMECLYLVQSVEQGFDQVKAGQGISHEEARARFAKWLR